MTEAIDLGIDGIVDAQPLNAGGNAIVYRARQPAMDRDVVVKILRAANDPAVKRRFEREQKAMGRLSQHRGIVPVYQSGLTTKNDPYLVMPFYKRGSLEDELTANGRFDPEQARQDLIAICEAMQVAHDHDVLHRDIKPGNILRSDEGRPIITDFGIARMMDHAQSVSTALTLTPLYSPPEVFEGAKPEVGHDIYGLGAVLFALLNGKAAFDRGEADSSVLSLMRRVAEHPLPPLPDDVPPGTVAVVRRAMAKKPGDRFESTAEFANALRDAPDYVAPTQLPRHTINSRPVTPTAGPGAAGAAGPGPIGPGGYTAVIRPLNEQAKKPSSPFWAIPIVLLLAVAAAVVYLVLSRGGADSSGDEGASVADTDVAPVAVPLAAEPEDGAANLPDAVAAADPLVIAAGLSAAAADIEGVACGQGFVTKGVLLGDNRVLVSMRYGRTAWTSEVSGGALRGAVPVKDVLIWPEVAMLRMESNVATTEPAPAIQVGSTVFVHGGTDDGPIAARVVALDQLAGRLEVAGELVPSDVMTRAGSPIVNGSGQAVGIVTGVTSPSELGVAFDPTLVVRDPIVAGGAPDPSCPASGGESFAPEADREWASARIAAFLKAQELANALARHDWDRVRVLEPGKAFLSDTRFENGWGDLVASTLLPLRANSPDGVVWSWRVGIVGHETHDGEPVTTLFCNTWQVDPGPGEVVQNSTDGFTIVAPTSPDPGWVEPLEYMTVLADAGC